MAERVGNAREGAVSAAQVPRRRRRAKVPGIGLDAAAALPAAVAVSARAAWSLKLRREQVHEKRAHTRREKPSRDAAPGYAVAAKALAAQINIPNRAEGEL